MQEKIESFHSAIPLLGIFPIEIITLDTHKDIHYSIMCNSKKGNNVYVHQKKNEKYESQTA